VRIAVFTNGYRPTINGVVNSIEAFRQGLEAAGHEVYVFAPGPYRPVEDPHFVFRYPSVCLGRCPDHPVALPFGRARGRGIGEPTVDVVHTQHPWWVGDWGLAYARRHRIPAVTTIHTQYEQYAHYAWPAPAGVLRGILRAGVRRHCSRCAIVMTPGRAMRGYLQELGVTSPIEVVPNATDLSGFDAADGGTVRAQYGVAPDDVLYAFVGRAAKEKSLDALIRSFCLVASELPPAKLMIVGGGPELGALKALAGSQACAERIILTGLIPYEQIRGYHAAADVFVTASVTEVQPLSLNEAMAARTPIAGIDAGGINDMVEDGVTGLLSPPDEGVEGLARVMLELGRNEALRARMAEAAREASRRYDIPQATGKLIEVYEAALERHGRR
jgi:1,2-diacylglycerol 3-alpha-glucosyltransferase